MAKRLEFSKKTKAAAMLRCQGKCEECGDKLLQPEYDHIVAAALGGTADFDNCMVLCKSCHAHKTHNWKDGDRKRINKANRLRAKAQAEIGQKSKAPMPGSRRSKWKRKLNGKVERR